MPTRATLTIAKQELKGFLDRPAGWVLMAVFVALVDFLFFRSAFISGEASLRPMMSTLPWIFLVFVPAVTMRLLAEEERGGTIEVLLTQPITELDVLVGKFLGGWAVVSLALATTLPVPMGLATASRLDWGVVVSQYLAGLLLAGAMVAIGVFSSSFTRNQVLASMVSVAISFFMIILGFDLLTLAVPRAVGEVFTAASLLSHTETMARGVLDLRDVLYFVSVVFVFGLGAYMVLHGKRSNRKTEAWYYLQVGAILLVGIAVALNMLAAPFGLRLDLTSNRLFTLAPATAKIVRESPDNITISLFASRDLPPQVATTYRDTRDLLRDYAGISKGRVALVEKFPDVDPSAQQAAEALGVQPVQFNVLEREQFSVKQGWLGIAIQAGTKREAIPFVQRTEDLEYQMTSLIRKMQGGAQRSTIAFTGGHNEKTAEDLSALRGELQKQYTVKDVTPADEGKGGLDLKGVRVLVVAGPQIPFGKAEKASIKKFIDGGGKALFMLEGYTINMQMRIGMPNESPGSDLVSGYGITVKKELMYDLRSNETVTFSGGQLAYTAQYPFWARLSAEAPAVTGDIDSALLLWPSPVSVSETGTPKGAQVIELLKTSPAAGVETGQPSVDPGRDYQVDQAQLAQRLGGVALQGPEGKSPWRIVLIGDSDFAVNDNVGNAPENMVLAQNVIDWLAQDDALAGIRAKASSTRQLRFESPVQQIIVGWGNQFGMPLLIAALGTWRLVRRRARARKGDAR